MAFSPLKRFRRFKAAALEDFYGQVQPLLELKQVQELAEYIQHRCHSRLSHSLDVAWFSYFIARLLRWDSASAARGGLLHDLFFYDRDDGTGAPRRHLRRHPRVALENARQICALNKKEANIIRRHMWLVTLVPPRYKEGYIVTFVDKYCALREALIGARNRRAAAGA